MAKYADPEERGYYRASDVTYAQLAQFVRRLTIGDATKDSDDYISSWILGNFTGGGQVEEINEGAETDRFYVAFAATDAANRNALPPLVRAVRPNANCSNCYPLDVGNDGVAYFAFNESGTWKVWGLNWSTIAFDYNAGAGVALGAIPGNKAVRFDGVIYVPLGTSGYSRVTGASGTPTVATVAGAADPTTANPTSAPRPVAFCVFQQRLWAITAQGGICNHSLAQKSAGANAWYWPRALTDTDFPRIESSATTKALAVFPDKNGVESLYVKTTRGVYIFDDKAGVFHETHVDFPPHPDINQSFCVWPPGGDLFAGVGMAAVKYSTAFVADPKFGLHRDHGLPAELRGAISDLEPTVDKLFALVGGVSEVNTGYGYSAQVGAAGTGNGQFADVRGLAPDSSNRILACDTNNERIQRFTNGLVFDSVLIAGGAGNGDGQFASNDGPYDLALTSADKILVVDRGNHRVQQFSAAGAYESEIGAQGYEYSAQVGAAGTGDGQFDDARGVAILSDGSVIVADENNERIQKFNSSLVFQSKTGAAGTSAGQFAADNGPFGLAVDSTDRIYVTDRGNHRVQRLTGALGSPTVLISGADWTPLGTFGPLFNGITTSRPQQVATDSSDNAYLADYDNLRIVKLNSSGAYVSSFSPADGALSVSPTGVTLDTSGNVYVCGINGTTGKLQKYNSSFTHQWTQSFASTALRQIATDGTHVYVTADTNIVYKRLSSTGAAVTSWGSTGTGNGQFSNPWGIDVDSTHVYVVDRGNDRVQKFTTAGTYVTKWGASGTGDGQIGDAVGCALDASGNLWVADYGNDRLSRYSSTGTFQVSIAQTDAYGVDLATGEVLWVSNWGGGTVTKYDEANIIDSPSGIAIEQTGGRIYVLTGDQVKYFTSAGVYEGAWGGTGTGDGAFSGPTHIAVNQSADTVYVLDAGNDRVQYFSATGSFQGKWTVGSNPTGLAIHPTSGNVFVGDLDDTVREYTSTGTSVRSFGATGSGNGQFNNLYGLAFDSSGNLFATDLTDERIQKFTKTAPVSGTGNGEFASPESIAIKTSSGRIYVLDTGNSRVQYFTSAGVYEGKWGSSGTGNGQLSSPGGIAVSQATGTVYVADTGNDRVQFFTATGTYSGQWGVTGTGNGQFQNPVALAINSLTDTVFVTDTTRDDVQEFTSAGAFVRSFGGTGTGNGQFQDARGIAFDSSNNVYVSDASVERIQKFVSQTSGALTAYPSVHHWTGVGWHGDYRHNSISATPTLLKAFSASDGYFLGWGMSDGFAYLMKLRRTFHNARTGFLAGIDEFSAGGSGVAYIETGFFDAAMEGFDKQASHLILLDPVATSTETIVVEFKADSGGWETLGTVSASAKKKVLAFDTVSGFSKGRRFNKLALRFTFARTTSGANPQYVTPLMDAATLHYQKIPINTVSFQLTVPLAPHHDRTAYEQYNDLTALVTAGEFLPLVFRRDSSESDGDAVSATFRVLIASISGTFDTGETGTGEAHLSLIALPVPADS